MAPALSSKGSLSSPSSSTAPFDRLAAAAERDQVSENFLKALTLLRDEKDKLCRLPDPQSREYKTAFLFFNEYLVSRPPLFRSRPCR